MQPQPTPTYKLQTAALNLGVLWRAGLIAVLLFLALYNLTSYPTTWYDEGSHLHVPKTLVRLGTYADLSSEGLRYYGPTIGVGPTVLLPIAGSFMLFGIGLLQARLVIVLYLLGTIIVFYRLAKVMDGSKLAWVACALLVTSRGVGLFEYGREVLGEVPALFFIISGLFLWFGAWEGASWRRLVAVGILLGLAVVTKTQFFIFLAPALALGWLANLIYYRLTPQRVFIIPGLLVGALFAIWQVYVVVFLGPGTVSDNLALYRAATASAATVFSPDLMRRSVEQLLGLSVYLGWLIPALVYGLILSLPKQRNSQWWGMLFIMAAVNLAWYVFASVSWIRYAFPALAICSLFVARLFQDLTGGYRFDFAALRRGLQGIQQQGLSLAMLALLAVMVIVPLGQTAKDIVKPPFNAPLAMAEYMNAHVPQDALVETWEPEMGFLTNHTYHFPPQKYLYQAVEYIWLGKTPPSQDYHYVETDSPEYVLLGPFAQWVGLYPPNVLAEHYNVVTTIGGYELYQLKTP